MTKKAKMRRQSKPTREKPAAEEEETVATTAALFFVSVTDFYFKTDGKKHEIYFEENVREKT